MHSLGIVQWNSTRRDHPGNPEGLSGSGLVNSHIFQGGDLLLLSKMQIPHPTLVMEWVCL